MKVNLKSEILRSQLHSGGAKWTDLRFTSTEGNPFRQSDHGPAAHGNEKRLLSSNCSPWERSSTLCHPSISTCLRQVEGEMTRRRSPWMRGPEGRTAKREPSPEGLGIDLEEDPSAVDAVLNRCVIRSTPTCRGKLTEE